MPKSGTKTSGGIARLLRQTPSWVLVVILLSIGLFGGWLWLRDSSLVAVKQVEIRGVAGADSKGIRLALTDAAKEMTTLHVRPGALRSAVAQYPQVSTLRVKRHFLNKLTVEVGLKAAVAVVGTGSVARTVTADGTVLRQGRTHRLPRIKFVYRTSQGRLTGPAARALGIVVAAPTQLRSHIAQVADTLHGIVATMGTKGPRIYFGDATAAKRKWAAVAAVLADSSNAGATYIDVRVPERPAVGGLQSVQSTSTTSVEP